MYKNAFEQLERLEDVIEIDRQGGVVQTMKLLESDLARYLSDFLNVVNIRLQLDGTNSGYLLNIAVECSNIYEVGKMVP